ncbi:hypothetical protein AYI68_g4200 [Smittium mucronatum]|uniref:Uncharacterized protein n=1 Tax=Smittium mucronatum TaxID=133383 RepID=A0A1R0GXR1_9FUNG|nr:hypothetical protein AYI68_g4200 [Smittium mucronatum]
MALRNPVTAKSQNSYDVSCLIERFFVGPHSLNCLRIGDMSIFGLTIDIIEASSKVLRNSENTGFLAIPSALSVSISVDDL